MFSVAGATRGKSSSADLSATVTRRGGLARVGILAAVLCAVLLGVVPASASASPTMSAGDKLTAGQTRVSTDGRFTLAMQGDGNLVEYLNVNGAPTRPLWASGTQGSGLWLAMQSDGNLVIYTAANRAVWAAGTAGHAGARLVVQTDGNIVIYTTSNQPLWTTGTAATGTGTMYPGDTLTAGQTRVSTDGRFTLVMQGDGNLVEYLNVNGAPTRPLWATGTQGSGLWLAMQSDGNLVIYTAANRAVWAAGTAGHAGARLVVQTDGNIVVYTTSDQPLWRTGVPSLGCSSTPGSGDAVHRWTPVVSCVLGMLGQPQTSQYVGAVLAVIACESGGNPNAINTTDINAQHGTPSRGLVQVIQPTFDSNHSPLLPNNIVDPAANIFAGMHYAIGRYGGILNIPTVRTGHCQGYSPV